MKPENNNSLSDKLKSYFDLRVAGILLFAVVAILITWSGLKVAKTNFELEKQIAELRQRNEVEHLENENLRLKNEYYKSQEYLELSARRLFNKAAPGEKLYLIPESVAMENTVEYTDKKASDRTKPKEEDKPTIQKNFEAWMEFFTGRG